MLALPVMIREGYGQIVYETFPHILLSNASLVTKSCIARFVEGDAFNPSALNDCSKVDLIAYSHTYSPTHTPKLNPIGQTDPEIQKCGLHVRTCRDITPKTCVKLLVHDPQLTHQKLNPIGQADPEIQKFGLHARTCRDTPPMTCVKHLCHDSKPTHQI